MNNQINGIPVIESLVMTKQVQAKKHRTKRINKKWLKLYGYRSEPSPDVFMMKDPFTQQQRIVGHPQTIKRLMRAIENKK